MIYINLYTYCWWLKSCTTCDTKNLVNVINYQPQLVSLPSSTMGEFHVSKFPRWMINCHLCQGHLVQNPQRVTNRIARYGWWRDGFFKFQVSDIWIFLVGWMIFFECSTHFSGASSQRSKKVTICHQKNGAEISPGTPLWWLAKTPSYRFAVGGILVAASSCCKLVHFEEVMTVINKDLRETTDSPSIGIAGSRTFLYLKWILEE